MAWSNSTMKLLDEVGLQGSQEYLQITQSRMSRDPAYASKIRISTLALFHELWPAGDTVEMYAYLVLVDRDIDKMPLDLLDDLTAALARKSKQDRRDDPPGSAAAQLIGNWLKMRSVELRANSPFRDHARKLKNEHKNFFRLALVSRHFVRPAMAS